jgi:hypothetical protein
MEGQTDKWTNRQTDGRIGSNAISIVQNCCKYSVETEKKKFWLKF